MDNLVIGATSQTPEVTFDLTGELAIAGVSTLSHAQKFYVVLVDWLKAFSDRKPSRVNLTLSMYYVNTSSALMFVDILRLVNSFKSENCTVNITWRFEEDDEDILSFGEQLQTATNSEFKFEEIS